MKTMTDLEHTKERIVCEAIGNPMLKAALCAFLIAMHGKDTEVENILDEIEAEAVAEAYKRSVSVCADMNDPRMDKVVEILREKVNA